MPTVRVRRDLYDVQWVDARSLLAGQASNDAHGRAKTGRAAAGTLCKWSQAILLAYLGKQFSGIELLDKTPLFWTRGGGGL